MTARSRAAVAGAGVLGGLGAGAALVWGGYTVPADLLAPTLVLDLAVGWSFIGVGLIAWSRRPGSRVGLLMVVLGFAWFGRLVVAIATPAGFVVGMLLNTLHLGVLIHLLVSFPDGRVRTWPQRVVVTISYLLATPADLVLLLLRGVPLLPTEAVPPGGVVITVRGAVQGLTVVGAGSQAFVAVFAASVIALVVRRWRRASAVRRRTAAPAVWGGVGIVAVILAQRVGYLLQVPPEVAVALAWAANVVLVVWPLALLIALMRSQLDRSSVGSLMIELGSGVPEPDRLRAALARTVHDPTLELAYWIPDEGVFVDAHGVPVAMAAGGDERAVTVVERDGEPIAALRHDAALVAEPELVDAVVAGAGMALQNERLHAEVRAQLREAQASRARLVDAGDAARRRVERDLHDGAQQALVSVALALRLARSQLGTVPTTETAALLDETAAELDTALRELRELARGIYPVLLSDAGLTPALRSLADRSPVPVVLAADDGPRMPTPVEQTCYFVVSEALANAAKHAAASEVRIGIGRRPGHVVVEIADDGVGGADPTGSGLRGLDDRVAAQGGRLDVHSPAGAGTTVRAEIPCA
ncbi:histidine kinase [Geodermatophilus sp. SYSU D01176]